MVFKLTAAPFVFACLFSSIAFTQTGPAGKVNSDTDQILAVVDSVASAWNAHDMNKFSALFTSDADWVNIRGARWKGVDAIRVNHVAIHKRFYSKSRVDFKEITVRIVTPDVAIVHAKETVSESDVPKEAGISPESQMSLVVVRRGGKWLIANGQNTNIISPPTTRP